MFLAEPPRTPYDFQFQILGFPVRVTPFFWLVAALLGYELSSSLHEEMGNSSPGQFALLLLWIAAVFLSILIHEMGHALVMRQFGQHASIILYHFGGLAVPDAFASFSGRSRSGNPESRILISLAGPGAQLLLAAIIVFGVSLSGHTSLAFTVWPVSLLQLPGAKSLPLLFDVLLLFLAMPSVSWALINLLPIFPLDGGQVSREILTMFKGSSGMRDSLILSIVTAGLAAAYFMSQPGGTFNAMLFLSLGVTSFQMLQMVRFGGGPW